MILFVLRYSTASVSLNPSNICGRAVPRVYFCMSMQHSWISFKNSGFEKYRFVVFVVVVVVVVVLMALRVA